MLVPVLVLNAGHWHRHPGSCPKIGLYIYIYNTDRFWGSFPGASAGACAGAKCRALALAPAQALALAPGKLPQNRSVLYSSIYIQTGFGAAFCVPVPVPLLISISVQE